MANKCAKDAKKGVKCAACGAQISDKNAKYVTDYEGQKYYFCSGDCMREFSSGTDRYIHE